MTDNNHLLDEIEPEVAGRIEAGSRDAFGRYGKLALVASAPVILAMGAKEAFAAGGLPQQVVDVLNFALTLEYIESNFYKMGNRSRGLIPSKYRSLFRTIGEHENEHVALLKHALGSAAVAPPKAD